MCPTQHPTALAKEEDMHFCQRLDCTQTLLWQIQQEDMSALTSSGLSALKRGKAFAAKSF